MNVSGPRIERVAVARRCGASDLDISQMRQRPHHASSLPNDQRELHLIQLLVAEHETSVSF
jgi:hypothetical protein